MVLLIVKYLASAAVVTAVSELAKRSDRAGALLGALPLVSVMVMIWLHFEMERPEKIGGYAWYTLWYVLPTLPMFGWMAWMLLRGMNFWCALASGIVVLLVAFVLLSSLLKRFGIDLLG